MIVKLEEEEILFFIVEDLKLIIIIMKIKLIKNVVEFIYVVFYLYNFI